MSARMNNTRVFTLFASILCYAIYSNLFIASNYTYQDILGATGKDYSIVAATTVTVANIFSDAQSQSQSPKENDTTNNLQQSTQTTSEEMISTAAASGNPEDTTTDNSTSFERYDGVVIVTKVLSEKDAGRVAKMLCFLQHSYNDKRKYDIVVFTTIPWAKKNIDKLQADLAPTKLTVAIEAPPLMDQVAAMTPEEKNFLYKRCNVTEGEDISWWHHCTEENYNTVANLGYAWQAEFRSYHIWTHDAIKDYKYMMWFDSDALVAREWDRDPMKVMIEKELILLFAAFPYGITRDKAVGDKMDKHYNKSICTILATAKALTLYPYFCDSSSQIAKIVQVGGFHHITSLDVYRKPIHQQFLKDFVGDYRFSRRNDDQIAVTIPAIMEQSTMEAGIPRIAEQRGTFANLTLHISHHGRFDGKRERSPVRAEVMFDKMKKTWPGLDERCGRLY